MEANLTKSLTDLIDDTLQELEELRKSRFAAAEIKIEGPGDGIADKPSNGDLDAKKADEDDDKDEDDKEESEEAKKADDESEDEESEEEEKAEKAEDKKEDKKEDKDEDHEEKERKLARKMLDMNKEDMKKSYDESTAFFKSHVEERVKPLEDKLATILDLVNKIAEQPVAPKGVTVKTAPLLKSEGSFEGGNEQLSKSEVASKLFELKKSGTRVDSLDITKAEMGQDLVNIIKKYEIS